MLLVGLVIGVLFRSLSHLMQRIMAPNEFIVLQDRLFANFNTVNSDVLLISGLAVLAVTLAGVRRYPSRIRCALLPWEAAKNALADQPA